MNLPRLSVVVPNYNHAAFLPACLNALLNQSVPPFEVIVIDDASTDGSGAVIEKFAARHPSVRFVQNDRNRGVVFNLNRGLELAQGEYVFFPAADDEVAPGLFEKSLRLLAENPAAALSCTISEWREGSLKWNMAVGMASQPRYLSPADLVGLGLSGKLLIVSHSAIMRREALVEAAGFIPELRWHSDWFATYVTAFRHGICFVPEVLSLVNIQPKSYYKSGRRKDEHQQVLCRILELLNSNSCADVRPLVRDSAALSLFAMPMLRLLLSRPEFRSYATPALVMKTLRRSGELLAKRLLPTWLAQLGLKLFYPARPR
jgi:glycosyltransferase involved in cell wall biosynthesis